MSSFASRIVFFFALGLSPLGAQAETQKTIITEILASDEVAIRSNLLLQSGDDLVVEENLATIQVTSMEAWQPGLFRGRAKISATRPNRVLKPGLSAKKVDWRNGTVLPEGSNYLLQKNRRTTARVAPLIKLPYTVGETAQTLHRGEYLISISSDYHYGLFEELKLTSNVLANLAGIYNFSAKARIFDNEDFTASFATSYIHWDNNSTRGLSTLVFNGYLDICSNGRFISHTSLRGVKSMLRSGSKAEKTDDDYLYTTAVRAGSQVVLESWNRLTFGPTYDFSTKSIGGFFGWIFIWDHLHVVISVETRSITRLKLYDEIGYKPGIEAYWRF